MKFERSRDSFVVFRFLFDFVSIFWPLDAAVVSLVYLLLPVFREELQGAFLNVFDLLFGQFSVYLSVNCSKAHRRKSIKSILK